jgi:uncharacterized protein YgbK (DUF1537 family)
VIRLGVIADDVTGACDLAGRVVEAGLPAVVTIGAPADGSSPVFPGDGAGCAVIALKSRTASVGRAVEESAASARRLLDDGATLLYQKYCSTFDSTPNGNIGPVADALAATVGGHALTVGTPATPGSGRTQYQGQLFVNGVPLAESPMREHPLTPMRDSDLRRLLQPQTPAPVGLVRRETVAAGAAAVSATIGATPHGHLLVDAITDHDLDAVAGAVLASAATRRLVAAGAAGLATALARAAGAGERVQLDPVADGARLILSGSASEATRAQHRAFRGERIIVDPLALAADPHGEQQRLCDALAAAEGRPVLVTATAEPAAVAAAQQRIGAERAAHLIESVLAELADVAVHTLGVTRLIVAGGETSGAVVARLGIDRLRVGEQVAPGVPWTTGISRDRRIALLLKSGNFGGDDLFTSAWEVAP